jgi:hypothetical protein
MRMRTPLLVVLTLAAIGAFSYWMQMRPTARPPSTAPADETSAGAVQPVAVATHRGADIRDGFRGERHPLLFGQTRLDVTATWTTIGKGRDQMHRDLNPTLYRWFSELAPAEPRRTYTERDLSAFLPHQVGEVGQTWALAPDKMVAILQQFHPRPSLQLVASGRRAGPNGAFALLRAVSPTHLDIVFRIHAEFYLTPEDWPANRPLIRAWYTPAYLAGRVLVNRTAGTVDYFRLALATEQALNVHLTVEAKGIGDTRQAHDIVRVEQMELTGGKAPSADEAAWAQALAPAEADRRLAQVFYKFLQIDWLPFDEVAERARGQDRPIFAVVSWGAFDDQSC